MKAKTMGEKITAALEVADKSQRQLAQGTAIPEATLRRKIATGDFTVPETERMALFLDVDPFDILPDSLLALRKEAPART